MPPQSPPCACDEGEGSIPSSSKALRNFVTQQISCFPRIGSHVKQWLRNNNNIGPVLCCCCARHTPGWFSACLVHCFEAVVETQLLSVLLFCSVHPFWLRSWKFYRMRAWFVYAGFWSCLWLLLLGSSCLGSLWLRIETWRSSSARWPGARDDGRLNRDSRHKWSLDMLVSTPSIYAPGAIIIFRFHDSVVL